MEFTSWEKIVGAVSLDGSWLLLNGCDVSTVGSVLLGFYLLLLSSYAANVYGCGSALLGFYLLLLSSYAANVYLTIEVHLSQDYNQ